MGEIKRKQLVALIVFVMFALMGCAASGERDWRDMPKPDGSDPDAMLKYRFRGIHGGELRVDATFATTYSVIVNADTGRKFNITTGGFSPGGSTTSGYGLSGPGDRLAVPKHLRLLRWPKDSKYLGRDPYPHYAGAPVLDVTVPVASRIPDAVLERIRQYPGSSLALRFRITPETLLVGWEIKLGQTYPFERDRAGNHVITNEDMMVGGDFWPAKPVWELQPDGTQEFVFKKGWQIDPKTGQRMEMDY